MANREMKVSFISDSKALVTDVKRMTDALEDGADELAGLTTKGARLEDDLRTLARQGKRAGDDLDDGFRKAREGADEFARETNSSLRESAASISDVSDGIDTLQEVLANALAGFGPVGAAAGLAAAIGFGLVTEEIRKQQEAADQAKERLGDMYSEALANGKLFIDQQQVQAEALRIYTDPGQYDAAKKAAADLGTDVGSYIAALSGDQSKLNELIDFGVKRQGDLATEGERQRDATYEDAAARADQIAAIAKVTDALEEVAGQHDLNIERGRAYQDFIATASEQEREQIRRTADTAEDRYRGLAGLPPVHLPVTIAEPDIDALRRRLQSKLDAGLAVPLNPVDRYGRRIV